MCTERISLDSKPTVVFEAELIVTLKTTDLANACGLVSSVYLNMAEDNGDKF